MSFADLFNGLHFRKERLYYSNKIIMDQRYGFLGVPNADND